MTRRVPASLRDAVRARSLVLRDDGRRVVDPRTHTGRQRRPDTPAWLWLQSTSGLVVGRRRRRRPRPRPRALAPCRRRTSLVTCLAHHPASCTTDRSAGGSLRSVHSRRFRRRMGFRSGSRRAGGRNSGRWSVGLVRAAQGGGGVVGGGGGERRARVGGAVVGGVDPDVPGGGVDDRVVVAAEQDQVV